MEKESALRKELLTVKQNLEERQTQREEEQRTLEEKHQKEVRFRFGQGLGETIFKKSIY